MPKVASYIKTYEEFGPNPNVLALPPHEENSERGNRVVMSIKSMMQLDHQDVVEVGNRINAMCKTMGAYVLVKHVDSGVFIVDQNEPCIIFGVTAGREITIGEHRAVKVTDDSIVFNIKTDDSLFIFSTKDNYEFVFIKPKVVISQHDPYGEEDWEDPYE